VSLANSHSLVPLLAVTMMKIQDFITGLDRTSKSTNEVKIITDAAFGIRP
jgi:hypothetical protein